MATIEFLTERERQALEQMRKAQERGSTLKEHAAKTAVDVRQLYELRRCLVRKVALGHSEHPPRRQARKRSEVGAFVAVSVAP